MSLLSDLQFCQLENDTLREQLSLIRKQKAAYKSIIDDCLTAIKVAQTMTTDPLLSHLIDNHLKNIGNKINDTKNGN